MVLARLVVKITDNKYGDITKHLNYGVRHRSFAVISTQSQDVFVLKLYYLIWWSGLEARGKA